VVRGLEARRVEPSTSVGKAGYASETPTGFIHTESKARVRLCTFVDVLIGSSGSNREHVEYEIWFILLACISGWVYTASGFFGGGSVVLE
jgi:hypothetical protein